MTPSSSQTGRPLDPIEYLYWLMDRTSSSTNFVVLAQYEGPLNQTTLQNALSSLQRSHPTLQMSIQSTDTVHFAPLSPLVPLPLHTHPTPNDPEQWLPILEASQQRPFATEAEPLARCIWLEHSSSSGHLCFVFHHAISDATSGLFLLHQLIQLINQQTTPDTTDSPSALVRHAFPAPALRARPRKLSGLTGLLRLWMQGNRQLWQLLRKGFPSREVVDAWAPPNKRTDRFFPMQLTQADTTALRDASRHHQTTVHAALLAAQFLALHAEYPSPKPRTMGQLSLVSLRQRSTPPVPMDAMAPCISFTSTIHRIHPLESFWTLAQEIQRELTGQLQHQDHWLTLPTLATIVHRQALHRPHKQSRAARLFQRIEAWGPKVSLLSNVGSLDAILPPASEGPLQLRSMSFFFALSSSGRIGASATTFAGQLHWNWTYAHPTFSPTRARRIAQRAKGYLIDAIEQDAPSNRPATASIDTRKG